MEDSNKYICRLCLEIVPPGVGEAIEETKKGILKILLINIDFDISDSTFACNRCIEKLQECFDFKSFCFYVDDYIAPFVNTDVRVDIKEVFQKAMMTIETVDLENVQICRLCMSLIEDECFNCITDSKDGVFLEEMIRNCLPEMDLNTVHEPLICKQCLSNTKKYKGFMKTCHEVEQRIKHYCQTITSHSIMDKVPLEDVLEFKDCGSKSVAIKKELPDVHNIESRVRVLKFPITEDTVSIKCEEVDIKEELNTKVEINVSDHDQLGDCIIFGRNGSSERKTTVATEKEQHRYFCPKCSYSSYENYKMKMHMMRCGSDRKVRKCVLCPFIIDSKLMRIAHMMSHMRRGLIKEYRCGECPFETDRRDSLVQHLLTHADETEVEMFTCSLCSLEGKYKTVVDKHYNLRHGRNLKMYECYECAYTTKQRKNFIRHLLVHRNPEEIPIYKCEKCKYSTKHKDYLTKHRIMHEESTKFKCEKCPYRGKRQSDFNIHMNRHSDKYPYSCEQCTYSSNVKNNLTKHQRVHQVEAAEAMLRCDLCDFRTTQKCYLRVHKYRKHDPILLTFKCNDCEYRTWGRARLNKHRRKHQKLGESAVYYCATCSFRTKYRESLTGHMLRANICMKTKREIDRNRRRERTI